MVKKKKFLTTSRFLGEFIERFQSIELMILYLQTLYIIAAELLGIFFEEISSNLCLCQSYLVASIKFLN
jgi:hypothetical protein